MIKTLAKILFKSVEYLFLIKQACRVITILVLSCVNQKGGTDCWKHFLSMCKLNLVKR